MGGKSTVYIHHDLSLPKAENMHESNKFPNDMKIKLSRNDEEIHHSH